MEIINAILFIVLSMLSIILFSIVWTLIKMALIERKMSWKPQTCSKNAPYWVQFETAASQQRWRDEVWLRATNRF